VVRSHKLNTHVLFFRRNFHTSATKRNSSATCSKGILWNIFCTSRHILRKKAVRSRVHGGCQNKMWFWIFSIFWPNL
jgi:hypothetical protein